MENDIGKIISVHPAEIIYTCPKCGGDLMELTLTINPPIPKKQCKRCGWSWIGKKHGVVRIQFEPPKEG